MIKIHIYNNARLFYSDVSGHIESAIASVPDGYDFTLTPPPNYSQPWYWYDNKWQSEPKPTP